MRQREPWVVVATCQHCGAEVRKRTVLKVGPAGDDSPGWALLALARHWATDEACPNHPTNRPPTKEAAYSEHVMSMFSGATRGRGPDDPAPTYSQEVML